ncbi:TolC family protein [soil metagenome]
MLFLVENLFSRVSARLIAGVAMILLTSVFAFGQDPQMTPTPKPTPDEVPPTQPNFAVPIKAMPDPARVGVDTGDPLPLTLDQAIEMALKNNNDIDASRNTVQIADFGVRASRGIYDPLLSSQTYYESRATPTASTIGGAVNGWVTQKQIFNDFGVTGFVPRYGGSYDVVLNSSRLNSTNRNATLNPQYPTSLVATFTQPLWRNLSIDANRRAILIAKKNVDLSDAELKTKAMDVVAGVEQAYWNLVFALRLLQVQTETLKQAKDQLESNKRLVAKGALAPIEIVAANSQIAGYEQAIYIAQDGVTRNENTLKTLMLPDRTAPEWSRSLTPVTPADIAVPRIGLEVATAEAIKNRPEIAQLEASSDINKIDQRYFKNQTKPQIDLVSSYTSSGLAGSPNLNSSGGSTVPENLQGGYFGSLTNLLQQDYPTYRFGVQVSLPWGNHVAKANLGRSYVEGDRIANQRAQTEQIVESEVRNALQTVRSAEARLASATDARAAAEELYASEERLFRGGTTTFYLVTQRQTELSRARSLELQARTLLNNAISDFQRAIGATLTVNNVTVSK